MIITHTTKLKTVSDATAVPICALSRNGPITGTVNADDDSMSEIITHAAIETTIRVARNILFMPLAAVTDCKLSENLAVSGKKDNLQSNFQPKDTCPVKEHHATAH